MTHRKITRDAVDEILGGKVTQWNDGSTRIELTLDEAVAVARRVDPSALLAGAS